MHVPGLDLAAGVLVELHVEQVPVELALGLELGRGADVLEPAVVQDDDLVAGADGREAVGQEDQRPAQGQPGERVVEKSRVSSSTGAAGSSTITIDGSCR